MKSANNLEDLEETCSECRDENRGEQEEAKRNKKSQEQKKQEGDKEFDTWMKQFKADRKDRMERRAKIFERQDFAERKRFPQISWTRIRDKNGNCYKGMLTTEETHKIISNCQRMRETLKELRERKQKTPLLNDSVDRFELELAATRGQIVSKEREKEMVGKSQFLANEDLAGPSLDNESSYQHQQLKKEVHSKDHAISATSRS